jgi:hypothetical protein
MSTAIFLVVVCVTCASPSIVVQQIPTMELCESIGEAIAARRKVEWTCIEGAS